MNLELYLCYLFHAYHLIKFEIGFGQRILVLEIPLNINNKTWFLMENILLYMSVF